MTKRRDVLKALALAPLAASFPWTREDVDIAADRVAQLGDARLSDPPQTLKFFNAQEWRTLHVLVDVIIPKDDRAGGATDAKVPQFMDFILSDGSTQNRTNMRNGLAWLDQESQKRFSKHFETLTVQQRHAILDDIAYPARATQELRANAMWFSQMRNLTAAGYFSSRVGYKSLGYTGGVAMPRWTGSSPEIMKKLGLSYDEWDKKYGRGY